jgi:hydroxymethylglutaryl-CoA lyase
VPTAAKVAFVESLVDAGVSSLEVTSFVHPDRVPAMADADEVYAAITRRPGVRYMALTPNERGYDRARAAGCDAIAVFTAASEGFTQANIRSTVKESLERFRVLAARAESDGVYVRGYVSTAFSCPYDGPVEPEAVRRVVEPLLAMGCDEVSLGDTTGSGTPASVARLLDALLVSIPAETLTLHFHDTWGMGVANVAQGLDHGIRSFDASAGGLGGCPYAPGATGNVATEDLLHLLHAMGYETGIDLEALTAAAATLGTYIDRPLPGRVHHATLAQKARSCS